MSGRDCLQVDLEFQNHEFTRMNFKKYIYFFNKESI